MNPFSFLKQQIRSCLEREAKLTPAERRMHQWQFYTTVNNVVYIVGKGGANTMFYMVGVKGERKLCLPKEMLDIIESWRGTRFSSYTIRRTPSKVDFGPFTSLEEASNVNRKKVQTGSYIVGHTSDGKKKRLYCLEQGLNSKQWIPVRKK